MQIGLSDTKIKGDCLSSSVIMINKNAQHNDSYQDCEKEFIHLITNINKITEHICYVHLINNYKQFV